MGPLTHSNKTAEMVSLEYFRVPPRWLFVKISDSKNNVGWGEASLEGHSEAVEGCLDAYREQLIGMDPEWVAHNPKLSGPLAEFFLAVTLNTSGRSSIDWVSTGEGQSS
jgi:L-alanine-DL-glutamate epimerase-like enolase superfamily enzyme